jgi:hypothetical protein
MSPFERLIPLGQIGTEEPGQYEFHIGPGPNNKILIANFGGPNGDSWGVMQIYDDRQSDWTGDFSSAKEALLPALWERYKAASPRNPYRIALGHMLVDAVSTRPSEVTYDEVSFGSPFSGLQVTLKGDCMSDQITAGSIVELKSGGPKMTVSEVKSWNGVMTAFVTGSRAA